MPSSLSWLVHDSKARERTQQILSSFMAKESRDELGLGAIRDSFSDQLFPGTSTIQTRLRYMLFIPWIYRQLEENKKFNAENFATEADRKERELGDVLRIADDNAGAFGKTKQGLLKRLPSNVYWSGLRTWGIFHQPLSQEGYHRIVKEIYEQRVLRIQKEKEASKQEDDKNVYLNSSLETWHKDLPEMPNDFPNSVVFPYRVQKRNSSLHVLKTPARLVSCIFWPKTVVKTMRSTGISILNSLGIIPISKYFPKHIKNFCITPSFFLPS